MAFWAQLITPNILLILILILDGPWNPTNAYMGQIPQDGENEHYVVFF